MILTPLFRSGFLASLVMLAGMASPATAAREGKPNVVLIIADDLGHAELGCYGQKKIRTPNLDRMAADGMRFTSFYAGSPVCAPSRCTLLTGKHAGHAHVRDNREVKPEGQTPIPSSEVTIAELLKSKGYATAGMGKWGLGFPGSAGDPLKQGFDHFFGYNCQRHAHNHYPTYLWDDDRRITLEGNPGGATGKQYSHDLFEARALAYLAENKDRPFFLYLPFTVSHLALQVPEDSLAEYRGKFDDRPYDGKQGYQPNATPRETYAAMVTRLDRTVGRILARIKELGIDDETLVLFTSDNGPTHANVGGADSKFFESAGTLRGLKGSVYEGGIRVPLIARWPGKVKAGSTSDFVGYFPDLMPTLLDVIGDSEILPPNLDGLSFAPTLLGNAAEQKSHPFLYWEFASYGGQQALRYGKWKVVCQNLAKGAHEVELYDLEQDPDEHSDVANMHPLTMERIRAILKEQHVRSALFPLPTVDPAPSRKKKG